jgi:hypothetical protein
LDVSTRFVFVFFFLTTNSGQKGCWPHMIICNA